MAIEVLLRLFNSSATTGKRQLTFNMVFMLVSSLAQILALAAVVPVVGTLLGDGDVENIDLGPLEHLLPSGIADSWGIAQFVLVFGVLYTLATLTRFVAARFQFAYAVRIQEKIGTSILDKHLQRTLQEIRGKQRSSDLSREIIEDTVFVVSTSVRSALELVTGLVYSACVVGFLLYLSFEITLIALVSVIAYYLLIYRALSNYVDRLGTHRNRQNSSRHDTLTSVLRNITEVKFRQLEDSLTAQFRRATLAVKKAEIRLFELGEFPQTLLEVFIFLVLCYFVAQAGGDSISPGEKQELIVTLGVFALSLRMLIPNARFIYLAQVNLAYAKQRFDGVMDSAEGKNNESAVKIAAPVSPLTVRQVSELQNRFEFTNVDFGYDEELIFKNLTLQIPRHGVVGITGESGVGKSTLLELLTGLIPLNSGQVVLNRAPDEKDRKHDLIAYIPQQVLLDAGTVKSNIHFGYEDHEGSEEQLRHAFKQANLADRIRTLGGLEGKITENGSNLSGGEKQRFSLARMFYLNRPVNLVDETLNALDTDTKRKVMKEIRQVSKDALFIIISHDNVILEHCDTVIDMTKDPDTDLRSISMEEVETAPAV